MPKHALGPTSTRQKLFDPPNVGGSSTPSDAVPEPQDMGAGHGYSSPITPSSLVLSNEVLLRSKIAQLESEGRTTMATAKPRAGEGGVRSNEKCVGAGKRGGSSNSDNDGGKSGGGGGGGGKGVSKVHSPDITDGSGPVRKDTSSPESKNDIMRRFDAEMTRARRSVSCGEESCRSGAARDADQEHGLPSDGVKVLKAMYTEQVRAVRMVSKQADVLLGKTQELEKSNEAMRSEATHCTREVARLEHGAAKLHSLSMELDGRRSSLLETRTKEAAEEAVKREDMNASWNAVVNDISTKIKEQEEERIAQDEENASLRAELEMLLKNYDNKRKASAEALKSQEDEQAVLKRRLEGLTIETEASAATENALKKEVEELTAAEQVLHRRIHEHGTRLKRQEVGLKASLETIDKIRVEEAALIASVGYLTSERETWLTRALVAGRSGPDEEDSRGDASFGDVGMDDLRLMFEDKARRVDELESEKDRLQLRCRELQVERTKLTKEAELMTEGVTRSLEDEAVQEVSDLMRMSAIPLGPLAKSIGCTPEAEAPVEVSPPTDREEDEGHVQGICRVPPTCDLDTR